MTLQYCVKAAKDIAENLSRLCHIRVIGQIGRVSKDGQAVLCIGIYGAKLHSGELVVIRSFT